MLATAGFLALFICSDSGSDSGSLILWFWGFLNPPQVQLETKTVGGIWSKTRFVPKNEIVMPTITEVITMQAVKFRLALLLDNDDNASTTTAAGGGGAGGNGLAGSGAGSDSSGGRSNSGERSSANCAFQKDPVVVNVFNHFDLRLPELKIVYAALMEEPASRR